MAHYIFHPSTIWVRPLFTELGPKNPHFAKKQTNICRLSGDINKHLYIFCISKGGMAVIATANAKCLAGKCVDENDENESKTYMMRPDSSPADVCLIYCRYSSSSAGCHCLERRHS